MDSKNQHTKESLGKQFPRLNRLRLLKFNRLPSTTIFLSNSLTVMQVNTEKSDRKFTSCIDAYEASIYFKK